MDIGVVLQTDPPATDLVERARQAETAGFSHVWTFDSCVLWQEPFVIYPRILAATSRVQVGPMVTNPATRDWSVTASLFATLNDMFGNRTVCGIGRGDSALRVIGLRPTSMQTFADAITVDQGAGGGPRGRAQRHDRAAPVGIGEPPPRLGRRVRSPGAAGRSASVPTGSSCRSPTRTSPRWTIDSVRGGGRGRRPRSRLDHDVRRCARLRRRRPRPPAGPAPLVRRHGRQPRGRPRRSLRRVRRTCPAP